MQIFLSRAFKAVSSDIAIIPYSRTVVMSDLSLHIERGLHATINLKYLAPAGQSVSALNFKANVVVDNTGAKIDEIFANSKLWLLTVCLIKENILSCLVPYQISFGIEQFGALR